MPAKLTGSRPFEPGATGWTASDLDDPEIERQWFAGRYEIVEGVLTKMAPAYFAGGNAAFNVAFFVKTFMRAQGISGRFSNEVDIVIDEPRVARADVVMLTPTDQIKQKKAAKRARRVDSRRTRILVPPTLVLESVSPGHESHDQRTKRKWYAEFGIANYWILDGFKQSLQCMTLRDGLYHDDAVGPHPRIQHQREARRRRRKDRWPDGIPVWELTGNDEMASLPPVVQLSNENSSSL